MSPLIPAALTTTELRLVPPGSGLDAATTLRFNDVEEEWVGYESVHPLTWVPPCAGSWARAD